MPFIYFFGKKNQFISKTRVVVVGSARERQNVPCAGSFSECPQQFRLGQGKDGNQGAPLWVAGAQGLGPSSGAFLGALTGGWTGSGAAVFQQGLVTWCSASRGPKLLHRRLGS